MGNLDKLFEKEKLSKMMESCDKNYFIRSKTDDYTVEEIISGGLVSVGESSLKIQTGRSERGFKRLFKKYDNSNSRIVEETYSFPKNSLIKSDDEMEKFLREMFNNTVRNKNIGDCESFLKKLTKAIAARISPDGISFFVVEIKQIDVTASGIKIKGCYVTKSSEFDINDYELDERCSTEELLKCVESEKSRTVFFFKYDEEIFVGYFKDFFAKLKEMVDFRKNDSCYPLNYTRNQVNS